MQVKLEKDSILVNNNITYYLNPDYVYIPIENKNLLKHQNELVYKNEIIGKDNKRSTVSGKCFGLTKLSTYKRLRNTLVIQNDFREISKEKSNKKRKLNVKELFDVLEKAGEIKILKKLKSKNYHNIILRAMNDNPYVYNELFLLKEGINDILEFLEQLSILFSSSKVIIAVKNDDSTIIDECLKIIGSYPSASLALTNGFYMEDLSGILKSSYNTLTLSVSELMKIKDVWENKISTTMIITIAGDAILEGKVLRIKKYTLLHDLIQKFIDITCDDYIIVANGLMTGFEINTLDYIIDDTVESINIMKKKPYKESECIKCGRCIKVCPKGVNPLTLKNKYLCNDCGLCSYICPAYINLRKKLKEYKK